MTSAINGSDPTSATRQQALVAKLQQQNQAAAKSTGAGAALSRLSALYESDGANKASSRLSSMADSLGIDQSTLLAQLQNGKGSQISNLLAMKTMINSSDEESSDETKPDLQAALEKLGRTGVQFDGKF